jgi:hypothetical protein
MVTNHTTFIAVPMDVSDPQVLKRFLDSLVEKIDIAYSNRGNSGFASGSMVSSTATTVAGVVQDLNSLATRYVRLDGSNKLEGALIYDKAYVFTDKLSLVNKSYVDSLYSPQKAPDLLNSESANPEIKANADKIDELINILKYSGILN